MNVSLQLDTPPTITQDLAVTLVNEASGREVQARPFLDGSVQVRDLEPGAWRLKVAHPNLVFNVVDQRIHVFPDRPTFVPIKISQDIFTNTPIRQTTAMDLAPEQKRLDDSGQKAGAQAKKVAGQPILAGDWNDLALTLGDVAKSTRDLSAKVAPLGHAHPELVAKLDELQNNLNTFFDVFGKTVAQLQRQIQLLALQRRVGDAVVDLPPQRKSQYQGILDQLKDVADDNPYVYTAKLKRVGELLQEQLAQDVQPGTPISAKPETKDLTQVVGALSAVTPSHDYQGEIQIQNRVEQQASRRALDLALTPMSR